MHPFLRYLLTERFGPGTVGSSFVGTNSKILDPDATGFGEIVSSGRNIFMGYIWDEKKTEVDTKEMDGNVWFRTGDIGR